MEQLLIFPDAGRSAGFPDDLLTYYPDVFNAKEGDEFLSTFIKNERWWQPTMTIYKKVVLTPRLIAWHGERVKKEPLPWTPELLHIKSKIEKIAGVNFTSVLLNYYRDGNDSVAWHSDKEWVYGKDAIIASVSFGQVRSFDIRKKSDHGEKYSIKLEHGSFLLMRPGLQDLFEHRIAKSTKPMGPRVNLTFRIIKRKNEI